VYHCTRSRSRMLSARIWDTKAISPPGVTISDAEPVQAEFGGRDLAEAEERRSEEEV
jgi:hypothetical protein